MRYRVTQEPTESYLAALAYFFLAYDDIYTTTHMCNTF